MKCHGLLAIFHRLREKIGSNYNSSKSRMVKTCTLNSLKKVSIIPEISESQESQFFVNSRVGIRLVFATRQLTRHVIAWFESWYNKSFS